MYIPKQEINQPVQSKQDTVDKFLQREGGGACFQMATKHRLLICLKIAFCVKHACKIAIKRVKICIETRAKLTKETNSNKVRYCAHFYDKLNMKT